MKTEEGKLDEVRLYYLSQIKNAEKKHRARLD
jgi:hypothetical protein